MTIHIHTHTHTKVLSKLQGTTSTNYNKDYSIWLYIGLKSVLAYLCYFAYFLGHTYFSFSFFFAYKHRAGKKCSPVKITDYVLIKLTNSHSNQETLVSSLVLTILLKVLWLFKSIVVFQ